jgi:cytochrome c-type protein NapC
MDTRNARAFRLARIVGFILVGIIGLGLLLTKVSASADVCGLCHEMAPAVAAWKTSSHTKVACPSCHEKPRPWYAFPQTLAVRSAMLTRDISLTLAKDPKPSKVETPTVPDSTCERCHNPARQITIRFGTLIKHTEHAKRNKSCLSCHYWTGHPKPGAEKPMLMMEQCFTCHGRTPGSKAPGTCDVCHPKSFSLSPTSHARKTWSTTHGSWSLTQRQPCAMCHERSFCDACHGVDMPHPPTWGKGDPPLHAAAGQKDATVCARCHPAKPDLCSMCHHEGWEPQKGPWVSQHPKMVAKRGASFCIECHTPTYCYDCHSKNVGPRSVFGSD